MTIVFPTLAVTFAGFGVWLFVRTVNRHKKLGWKAWASIVLSGLVLYVLSAAPAEILEMKYGDPDWNVDTPTRMILRPIYAPLSWLMRIAPGPVAECNQAYAEWWARILMGDEDSPSE